ncbi:MAG: phosphate signaling complex protein PhoU [Desulfovibrio sp.]|jgi:phosphate transport system protein|nr:phosphate signaling complex protein PhoU [Desulfovibrio sp.]
MNEKKTQLQKGIAQLRSHFLVMCATVGIAVDDACTALTTGNLGRAGAVVDGDAAVDALENEIDEMALSLLARYQPVAYDLRFIVGTLRMVVDLERIGDEAVCIAERAIVLHELLPEPVLTAVNSLMTMATANYRKAVESFCTADIGQALAICRSEDETTQMEVAALHRIMDCFCSDGGGDGGRSYMGMHGILICRSLTRICRRLSNIAEQTYFIAKGVNIKHISLLRSGSR